MKIQPLSKDINTIHFQNYSVLNSYKFTLGVNLVDYRDTFQRKPYRRKNPMGHLTKQTEFRLNPFSDVSIIVFKVDPVFSDVNHFCKTLNFLKFVQDSFTYFM